MKQVAFLTIFLVISSVAALCQPWLGIRGQGETGWWVYHKGFDGSGVYLGSDRTRHAEVYTGGISAGWRFSKVDVGIELSRAGFLVGMMEASGHSSSNNQLYRIAKGGVVLSQFGLVVGYRLLERRKYAVLPRVGVGGFGITTIHPQSERFGTKVMWSGGMQFDWNVGKRMTLSSALMHTIMHIAMLNASDGEYHRIYRSGLHVMLSYNFKRNE